MADDLKQIDTSTIAELARIREEEDRFQERLQKMETSRGKVSPAVYERVARDYTSRLAELDAEARPLRERARTEYAKLRVLQADAERGVQEVGLAKEELEFRKELGEFPEGDFAKRLAACQQDLADRKAWAEEIGRVRDQFRKAFRSDQELEAPAAPSAAAPVAAAPTPAAAAKPREPDTRPAQGPASTQPTPAPSGTIVVPTSMAALAAAADATVTSPPPSGPKAPVTTQVATAPASSSSQATMVTPVASVVRMVDGKEEQVFTLRPDTNTIGRSPKNEIELPFTEISRRHAEISLGPEGFRIVDLNSNNGIFVNGQKVKEHVLADGDTIQIGTQTLLFRA